MCGMTTCVYVYICVCRYMCTYACEGQRLTISSFLIAFCFSHWGRVFQSSRVLTDRAGLARLLAPRTPYLSLPRVGIMWVLGVWTCFFTRSRQVPHLLSCLPTSYFLLVLISMVCWDSRWPSLLSRRWQSNRPLQRAQWRHQRKGRLEKWTQHSFLCRNHQPETASWCHPAARLPTSDQRKESSSMVRVGTWGLIFFFFKY